MIKDQKKPHFNQTHGKRGTKVYQAWTDMIRRCNNPKRDSYKSYGGRGIKVCDEWMKFENFYKDMGDPEPGMSLERIYINGNYEPSNCKWIPLENQCLNKTVSKFVTVDGVKMNISVASRKFGITETGIRLRLLRGWTDEAAVKTPSRTTVKPRKKKS